MSDQDPVLYEERDDIAVITLNRPEKKNTLTDAVIQGIARLPQLAKPAGWWRSSATRVCVPARRAAMCRCAAHT